MTRALVMHLFEALLHAVPSDQADEQAEAIAAITAAREYLTNEPVPKLTETPAQQAKTVGDSRFEGWYSELNQSGKGNKQIAREAYEAGLNETNSQQAEHDDSDSTFDAERFLRIYADVCIGVPDLTLRAIAICDDIAWQRGTALYRRAVHYGLMQERDALNVQQAERESVTEPDADSNDA